MCESYCIPTFYLAKIILFLQYCRNRFEEPAQSDQPSTHFPEGIRMAVRSGCTSFLVYRGTLPLGSHHEQKRAVRWEERPYKVFALP